jgi:hypothetical protein
MAETPAENPAEVDQMTVAATIRRSTPRSSCSPTTREPQPTDGDTTYYFVADGIESALTRARSGRERRHFDPRRRERAKTDFPAATGAS